MATHLMWAHVYTRVSLRIMQRVALMCPTDLRKEKKLMGEVRKGREKGEESL